ncbi:MAG TPA: CHRD domain-containing protein [Flavisolibacter sp.]|nr:CHRD domain-containing protein [Flavisolibacter sp.]
MKYIFLLSCLVASCVFTACTKGGTLEGVSGGSYAVAASLDGSKLAPATTNDTTKATMTGWYDEEANNLVFTLSYKKDTTVFKKDTLVNIYLFKEKPVTLAAFARKFSFTVNIDATTKPNPTNISGSFNYGLSGNTQLTAEEETSFLAGNWYAVLVSKKFPNGVAAGQITAVKK